MHSGNKSGRILAAGFSPIMIEDTLVLSPTTCGMNEASARRNGL